MIGIYARVSTTGQDLAGQQAELTVWAKAQTDPVSWYEDKATGKNMKRAGWERLWADATSGKISRIVVWRLDRLGRTAKGLVDLMEECQCRKIGLVSLREGFNLETPAGRLMFMVLSGVAIYEIEVKSERQQIGITQAKERGAYTGKGKGTTNLKTRQQAKAVLALHQTNTTVSEIGRITGLSRPTVRQIVKQAAQTPV
jgi:DNA invertase Pin-like site-specific DNA recombinase